MIRMMSYGSRPNFNSGWDNLIIILPLIAIGCKCTEEDVENYGFEAINISNTPYRSEDPSMAVGPDGTIYVFWYESRYDPPGSTGIYYRYRSPNGKWSDVTFLSRGGGGCCVKIDQSGTIHLAYAWEGLIRYIRKPPAGEWSQPEFVTALGRSCDPKFEIDKWGNIHLIFSELIGAIRLFYSKRSSNGTWSLPVELNREEAFHRTRKRIAVNAQGDAHVVWLNIVADTGPDYFLYTTNAIGDTWSYPVPVNLNDAIVHFTSDIAVDSRGTIHVAWAESNYHENGPLYRYNEFGKWSEIAVVDSPGGTRVLLTVDETDRLHLVYNSQIKRGTFYPYYRNKRVYGEWSEPVCLSTNIYASFLSDFAVHAGNVYFIFWGSPETVIEDIFFVEGHNLY